MPSAAVGVARPAAISLKGDDVKSATQRRLVMVAAASITTVTTIVRETDTSLDAIVISLSDRAPLVAVSLPSLLEFDRPFCDRR